jgi:hypothetical protein
VVRLFQQCFASSRSDVSGLQPEFNDPDGLLVWWVSDKWPEELPLPRWASAVVLVRMQRPADLRQLVSYVQAYQTLLKGKVIPEQDWVARREAQERLAASLQKLHEQVIPLLQVGPVSEVKILEPQSIEVEESGHRSCAALLSEICDQVYPHTPRIPNEMLSRRELTSQGAKARRMLIEALANHSGALLCGMSKGYGPERAMLDAVVGFHGLQRGSQGLTWPDKDSDLLPAYACIDSFFRGALHCKRQLSEMWEQLKAPPFGLKDGPVPVLLAHYLLLHDNQVGLYEDGRFVPGVETAVIERLAKNPETFQCSSFSLDGLRKTFVRKLLDELEIECPRGLTLLYAVKHLLRQARKWPSHTRYTQNVSPHAKALRKAFLGAKEPDQLLFFDLPKAVGVEKIKKGSLEAVVQAVAMGMRELDARYSSLLDEMQETIGKVLNARGPSVRADVAPRAARLKDQVLDPKLRAFAVALADQDLAEGSDWIQRVGLSLLGKAPSEWIDGDVQRFHVALNELAPAFRRLEALHFTQQSDGQAGFRAVRLGLTTSEGVDHQQVISVPDDLASALQSFVDKILAEAIYSFGEGGAQLVLAQWAQQAMAQATSCVDELAQQRHAETTNVLSHHG